MLQLVCHPFSTPIVEAFAASNLRLSESEIPAEAGLLSFSMTTALLFMIL
jgi:hypothetical protein